MGSLHNITAPVAKATAAAPTITEGDVAGLSQDLSGNLRVAATIGAVSVSSDATATAAAPSYVEGTPNAISQNLTGDQRVIAKIAAAQTLATVTTVGTLTTITNPVSQAGYSFTNITTATTTTVKSGAGTLHAVIVNTKGTVASTTTIYDNTAGSGTVIGIIDSLTLSGTFQFDINFATGLTLVTTGTVAPNITVSYR